MDLVAALRASDGEGVIARVQLTALGKVWDTPSDCATVCLTPDRIAQSAQRPYTPVRRSRGREQRNARQRHCEAACRSIPPPLCSRTLDLRTGCENRSSPTSLRIRTLLPSLLRLHNLQYRAAGFTAKSRRISALFSTTYRPLAGSCCLSATSGCRGIA
jgi:hypothetical protein